MPIGNQKEISSRMREGERERTIAATKMNENSRFVCLHFPYARSFVMEMSGYITMH